MQYAAKPRIQLLLVTNEKLVLRRIWSEAGPNASLCSLARRQIAPYRWRFLAAGTDDEIPIRCMGGGACARTGAGLRRAASVQRARPGDDGSRVRSASFAGRFACRLL